MKDPDDNPSKCGLEAWRRLTKDLRRLSWDELYNRHKWCTQPDRPRGYADMAEAFHKYERQLEILKGTDREDEFEVNDATVRGVILHTIVGNREATRELYNELADFTKFGGKYRQIKNVVESAF